MAYFVNFLVKAALVAYCQHISANPQEEIKESVWPSHKINASVLTKNMMDTANHAQHIRKPVPLKKDDQCRDIDLVYLWYSFFTYEWRWATLHVEYTVREVISSVMKHIKEAVKQPADIDLFRVNWRSRKADTLSLPIDSTHTCTQYLNVLSKNNWLLRNPKVRKSKKQEGILMWTKYCVLCDSPIMLLTLLTLTTNETSSYPLSSLWKSIKWF